MQLPTQRATERADLAHRLANDGRRLTSELAPRGALAARVRTILDAGTPPAPGRDRTGSAPRGGPLGRVAGFAAAALVLLLALPRGWTGAPTGERGSAAPPVAAPATPLPMLAPHELEQLHPVHLLRALPASLNQLLAAEADDLGADVRNVGEGLAQRLPAFLGLRDRRR